MDDQTWGIIGHTWAVDALRHAIAQDRVPHALLFVGPAGVGKRTLARAFARALHCLAPDVAARPCGHCRPCELIANDAYPDVHLIETQRTPGKARERRDISIDQIRALQHQVSLKPYNGRWAVGIIADAHEMSDAAANCLLKTLEEPQARVVLVLTATDVTLLLPTIVSRCQVFPLRPLAREETRMALMERFGLTPEHAGLLAHLSGGRLGWAVRAAQDEGILADRRQRLDALVHLTSASRSQRLAQAAAMSEEFARGQDSRDLVYDTLDLWATWWRDLLLVQEGCPGLVTNTDRTDDLRSGLARYPSGEVIRCLGSINATRQHLQRNANPRLALEVLLLSLPQRR